MRRDIINKKRKQHINSKFRFVLYFSSAAETKAATNPRDVGDADGRERAGKVVDGYGADKLARPPEVVHSGGRDGELLDKVDVAYRDVKLDEQENNKTLEKQEGKRSDEEALPGKNGKKTKKVKRSVKTPHKSTQPAIKIGGERHPVSLPKTSDGDKLFTSGFYSVLSGDTKYISGKQFKRLMKKPNDIECVFIIRPKTEKESGDDAQVQIDIDSYREHPAYPVLLKHKFVFQKKLPSALPPRGHGEHVIKVDTDELIFRRQWRLSPAQEKVTMDWVCGLEASKRLRSAESKSSE
ncbi:unnamed protein product [Phytophthora lilii]|uniref:Unnamed protein product n=1 Tax=Phytophthora lilii TaxID=2077276 RepID=A0A9W6XFI5_9STRA|nr:unnamed protein product [Phytophthora lilii]